MNKACLLPHVVFDCLIQGLVLQHESFNLFLLMLNIYITNAFQIMSTVVSQDRLQTFLFKIVLIKFIRCFVSNDL